MKIQWTSKASSDLVRLHEHLGPVAPEAAARVVQQLAHAPDRLLDYPRIGEKLEAYEPREIRRIIGREIPGAPHETMLILDAATGQNAVNQARIFKEAAEVTGIVLPKLDGTAKGGVVVAIRREFDLPIRYIGIGESVEDLRPFDAVEFVEALF